jgi:hypothetical protein
MPEKTPVEMSALLSAGLMAEYMPILLDEIKDELNTKIIEYIGKHLEGREVTHDIKTEFKTSGDETSGEIQIDLGPIKGEHEERVRGYRRKGKQVKGHSRTLKDKGVFNDGEDFVTSDTIPNDIIYKQIVKPHLEDKFSTKFADDIPLQEN